MSNKTALVTGSSKGIGRSIAIHLAKKGYDIIINSRTLKPDYWGEGAQDVQRCVEELGRRAYICTADIGREEGRQKLLDLIDRIGRLDILVNNAAVEPPAADILEVSEEELNNTFAVNFFGPFYLTREIAKRMIAWKANGVIEQARIGFITSIQVDRLSHVSSYCFSKTTMRNAVKQLAVRLGEADIPVLEFTPGVFRTSMSVLNEDGITQHLAEGSWAVNKRWGELDEIGSLVASLADGIFDYSTGAVIPVSGGMDIFRL